MERFIPNIKIYFFTAHKRSLGQGNIFAPVCHSVHGGLPQCMLGYLLGADTPLVADIPLVPDTPWSRHPPGSRHPPTPEADTPPPCSGHAGRYGQQAGGTHLTGMHSCYLYFSTLQSSLAVKILHLMISG